MAVKVKVAVMTRALPVAWTTRISTDRDTNAGPGLKNWRKLKIGTVRLFDALVRKTMEIHSPRQEAADTTSEHPDDEREPDTDKLQLE